MTLNMEIKKIQISKSIDVTKWHHIYTSDTKKYTETSTYTILLELNGDRGTNCETA